MYEGEYDDEMDYDEEGPEDDEDNISDEDEEIEGMGPIEGLSGDHGVDVEVIMDDDEDDDDEDSEDDDDDEHDSEDDDARVEIIDEVGNVQQLTEEDDMGEWESDDDDDDDEGAEEDYEGQAAADQAEQQMQAMGHLVRAIEGGDDATLDMIERMEADGLDLGEDDERPGGPEYEEDDGEGMSASMILFRLFY